MKEIAILSILLSLFGCRLEDSELNADRMVMAKSAVRGGDEEFITIPAGSFIMGSPETENGRIGGETQHVVKISKSFEMGKYEVTQGQWKAIMGENPSYFEGSDDLPVERVTWKDVQVFIQKLNNGSSRCGDTATDEGFKKAFSTSGCFRLPTEAEWEYAARAGTNTPFYTGEYITRDQANFDGTKTISVEELDAENPWGLMHMSGNVWEWIQDWYGRYELDEENEMDPMGASFGYFRVLRGGSWASQSANVRSASRGGSEMSYRNFLIGFRVVRTK